MGNFLLVFHKKIHLLAKEKCAGGSAGR